MNLKVITYLTIMSSYINYSNGINHINNKFRILKCKSAPDLKMIYNDTAYNNNKKNIISCDDYKKYFNNKNKRNSYLRSKEKYNFGDAK